MNLSFISRFLPLLVLLLFAAIVLVPVLRAATFDRMNSLEIRLQKRKRTVLVLTLLLYVVAVVLIQFHHERWRDEAQAWLIARDARGLTVLLRQLHYEGSPGLWHLVLMPFARSGLGYGAISTINLLFAVGAVAIILFYLDLPLLLRLLLPFTVLFLREYSTIARSYALSAFLLYAALALYTHRRRAWWAWSGCLFLLASTNAHSLLLCGAFGFYLAADWLGDKKKATVFAAALVFLGACISLWQVYPLPADLGTGSHLRWSEALVLSGSNVAGLHTGRFAMVVYVAMVAAMFAGMRTTKARICLAAGQVLLLLLFAFVHTGEHRHHYFLLLHIIFCLGLDGRPKRLGLGYLFLLTCVFALIWRGVSEARKEWRYSFSDATDAAAYLSTRLAEEPRTLIIAHSDSRGAALLPYLPGTRLYYPQGNRWGTYIVWNQGRNDGTDWQPLPWPAVRQIRLAHPGYARYYFLSSHPASETPPDTVAVPEAVFNRNGNSVTWGKEQYYLYRLR
jgi:hypothetical protein